MELEIAAQRGKTGTGYTAELHAETRQGRHVRLWLREEVVLEYEDPQPLPGGRAALWTVDNGLLLAKVRLAAEQLGAPEPPLRTCRPFADHRLTNDCHDGQTAVTRHGATYALTNTTGGGRFAVALRPRLYSALESPSISFDARVPPGVNIDFYFRCRGMQYRIIRTGPADGPPGVENLGRCEGLEADGAWHTARFDLMGALRDRHLGDSLLLVWQPEFANYANPDYLLAGFGGNATDATYWLRNIQTGENPGTPESPHVAP